MELQNLSESDRESVFKIMEVCGIEIPEAINLLKKYNFNFEVALQSHISKNQGPISFQNNHLSYREQQLNLDPDLDLDDPEQIQYIKYKKYKQTKMTFNKKYSLKQPIIRKFKSILPRNWRTEIRGGDQFRAKLQEIKGLTNKINFHKGTFLQNCEDTAANKFPLVTLFWDFSKLTLNELKKIIEQEKMVKFLNEGFWLLGLDVNKYQFEQQLKKFINIKQDCPCVAVFRVDMFDQIILLQKIKLGADFDIKYIEKKINGARSINIRALMQQNMHAKRYQNESFGIFKQPTMSFQKRMKLSQQRKLRQEQEINLKISLELQQKKQLQQKLKREEEEMKQTQKILHQSMILDRRNNIRKQIPKFQEGIQFKMRLPSGEYCKQIIGKDAKIQLLFDLIQSLQDCGFQNDIDRNFEIMRPYDKLILSKVKQSTIYEIFGDTENENLIVNEI